MQSIIDKLATKIYVTNSHTQYYAKWSNIKSLCKKWALNRDPDQARVNELIEFHTNGGYVPLFIHLAEIPNEVGLVCYDGNHRREMMDSVNYDGYCTINIMFSASKEQVINAFNNLNKSVQVPLVYLEPTDTGIKESLIKLVKTYEDNYKQFISTSPKCHSPNFNRDTFTDNLYAIYMSFNGSININDLKTLLDKLNVEYASGRLCLPHDSYKPNVIEKCKKYNLWLFINKTIPFEHIKILHDVDAMDVDVVEPQNNGENMEQDKKIVKKKTIPKPLRNSVWNKHIGKEKGIGNCFCCHSDIDSKHFECGHVISEATGGDTTVNNLRPVCSLCNKSMGTMDMNTFINMINKDSKVVNMRDIVKEYEFVEKPHRRFTDMFFTTDYTDYKECSQMDYSYLSSHEIYCKLDNFDALTKKYFINQNDIKDKIGIGSHHKDYIKIKMNDLVSTLSKSGITVIDDNLSRINITN